MSRGDPREEGKAAPKTTDMPPKAPHIQPEAEARKPMFLREREGVPTQPRYFRPFLTLTRSFLMPAAWVTW